MPRYALWIAVQEAGFDPERIATHQVTRFVDRHLDPFLVEVGLVLASKRRTRLRRRLDRFDPSVPTPYETMQRIFGGPS